MTIRLPARERFGGNKHGECAMSEKFWNIYLAGEIHSDWRDRIMAGAKEKNLPVTFSGPVTDHDASDLCGVSILEKNLRVSGRTERAPVSTLFAPRI
jgi:hypothetical protein